MVGAVGALCGVKISNSVIDNNVPVYPEKIRND